MLHWIVLLLVLALLPWPSAHVAVAERHGVTDNDAKAPSGQSCTPQDGYALRITVTWQPPSLPPPDDATLAHYLLERQVDTSPYEAFPPFAPNVLRYVDTDIQIGKTYKYQIKARYRFSQDRLVDSSYAAIVPEQDFQPCVTIRELAPPSGITVRVQ